ncbi:MAG: hypothetical protein QXS93_01450 [Candidatus Micrarchaeia archaeon]
MKNYKPEKITSIPKDDGYVFKAWNNVKESTKRFLKVAVLASGLMAVQCADEATPYVEVNVPEQKTPIVKVVNDNEEPKFKFCPGTSKIDFSKEDKTATMDMGNFMKLENDVIAYLEDIINTNNEKSKAVLKLWYAGRDNAKEAVVGVGDSITVVNPDGVEQVLECCSVIAGYTLTAKKAVFASDKSLQLIKEDVTPIKSTCEFPSTAINLSANGMLHIGESLPLDNGRRLMLKDILATANPEETQVVVNIVDKDGVLLKEASLGLSCIHEVSVNGQVYKIYVEEVGLGYTLGNRWAKLGIVSSVDSCWPTQELSAETSTYKMGYMGTDNEQYIENVWASIGSAQGTNCGGNRLLVEHASSFKYAIPFSDVHLRKRVMYLDSEMILSKADDKSVELVTEKKYQLLHISDQLDLGDGNLLLVKDLVPASGNRADAAVLEIVNSTGESIAKGVVSVDEGVARIGEYMVRVWEVAPGYTLAEKWASISVIDKYTVIRDSGGKSEYSGNSNGWDYWTTSSIETKDDALKGWKISFTYKQGKSQ